MIFTIGHSTRTFDEFVGLLKDHHVARIADIRTVPRSRRFPHFAREALAPALAAVQIDYAHFPGLGGLRRPLRESVNTAWRNDSFRGYADYMGTPPFEQAMADLLEFARGGITAVMCAEAVWWRCHRRLLADVLVARDMEVFHIVSRGSGGMHRLSPMARAVHGRVTYPGEAGENVQPGRRGARLNG